MNTGKVITDNIQYLNRLIFSSELAYYVLGTDCQMSEEDFSDCYSKVSIDTYWKIRDTEQIVRCYLIVPPIFVNDLESIDKAFVESYEKNTEDIYNGEWFDLFILPQVRTVVDYLNKKGHFTDSSLLYEIYFDANAHIVGDIHICGDECEDYDVKFNKVISDFEKLSTMTFVIDEKY